MNPFSLLIKPCGGDCNLDCDYCFYRGHSGGRMDAGLLRRAIEGYAALPFAGKSVVFQGGEPTLAGVDFFRQTCCGFPKGDDGIVFSLQTNGTLLTDEWAEFFASEGWLVGVSVDGPPELHNRCRAGHEATVRGIRALERADVDYNLLTVVSKANVSDPKRVYTYLRSMFDTRFHQYIECTGPIPELAVAGEEWGRFMIGIFDEWSIRDTRTVSVRLFDSIVSEMVEGHPTQCTFSSGCLGALVLDWDGGVYPCDFNVKPELRLGDIATDSWTKLQKSPILREFVAAKLDKVCPDCIACPYWRFCRGDCPRNRSAGRSVLCEGYRSFFAHALGPLADIVRGYYGRVLRDRLACEDARPSDHHERCVAYH